MRTYELTCVHGIGHSGGIHGCDGCCALLTTPAIESFKRRTIDRINEQVSDLRLCTKNDSCQEFAILLESYIEDWMSDEV